MSTPNTLHRHAEAFKAMNYAAQNGSKEFQVWNSRDGVTPFNFYDADGLEYVHSQWNRDEYRPHHQPQAGELIWRDATADEANALADEYINHNRAEMLKHGLTPEQIDEIRTEKVQYWYRMPLLARVNEDGTSTLEPRPGVALNGGKKPWPGRGEGRVSFNQRFA